MLASLIVGYRVEHRALGVPLLASLGELSGRWWVAHRVDLRMSVRAFAFVGAVSSSAVGCARGDDGRCQTRSSGRCRSRATRRFRCLVVSAERQVHLSEVASSWEWWRHDEIEAQRGAGFGLGGNGFDFASGAVLLECWTEFGEFGECVAVQLGHLRVAVLVIM